MTVGKSDWSEPSLDDGSCMKSSHWSKTTPSTSVMMSWGQTGPTSFTTGGNIVVVGSSNDTTGSNGSMASLTTVAVPLHIALTPPLHIVITWPEVGGVSGSLRLPIVDEWAWPTSHHPMAISAPAPMSHRRRRRPFWRIKEGAEMQTNYRVSTYCHIVWTHTETTCIIVIGLGPTLSGNACMSLVEIVSRDVYTKSQ